MENQRTGDASASPRVEEGNSGTCQRRRFPHQLYHRSVRTDSGGAPGRDVGRTRRISFTVVRKTAPKPDEAERKPLGWRAREWQRMLDEGVYRNQSELARGEGVSTPAVSIALGKLRR